jgi:hypothetical protein
VLNGAELRVSSYQGKAWIMTNGTTSRDASTTQHLNVALLADRPAEVQSMVEALEDYASPEPRQIQVWLSIERFRAPSGIHPPYRSLARTEARNITAGRIAEAEASAKEALQRTEVRTAQIESLLDTDSAAVALLLQDEQIDLLVCQVGTKAAIIGGQAAARAACSLLLVPRSASADGQVGFGAHSIGRLIRAHG